MDCVITECLLCCAVLARSVLQGLRRHYGTFTTVTGDLLICVRGEFWGCPSVAIYHHDGATWRSTAAQGALAHFTFAEKTLGANIYVAYSVLMAVLY